MKTFCGYVLLKESQNRVHEVTQIKYVLQLPTVVMPY